jgi:hypothetical protein
MNMSIKHMYIRAGPPVSGRNRRTPELRTVNTPRNPLRPTTHGGRQPMHGGRQSLGPLSLGTSKLCGHQPFGATDPANLKGPPLWSPQALGAPEPWGPLGQA